MLLVVTFATFCLMFRNGPGIARSVLGMSATPEGIQAKVAELGLDRPLLVQYGDWLRGAVTGDLGQSFYTAESVTAALANRVPVTLALVILTLLLTAILSVLLGVIAAVRGGATDRVVQVVSVLGAAVPAFIVAIALVFTFAIAWRVLPGHRLRSAGRERARLAGVGDAAGHRPADRGRRRSGGPVPDRRAGHRGQGLRPHAPGARHLRASRGVAARAAQLRRPRHDRAQPDHDRPAGRGGVHRAGVRAARHGPAGGLVGDRSATCRW